MINNNVVYSAPLAVDRLQRNAQLDVSQYPTALVRAEVDSPRRRTELLFFPRDPEQSFTTLQAWNRNPMGSFVGTARGFVHNGGQATYPVGPQLEQANPFMGVRVAGMYERVHGECELRVGWSEFLDVVLLGINNSSGEAPCNDVFCPDYDTTIFSRVARSYLRQGSPSQIGGLGQGGFGLHIRGETEFDSWGIDDLSFYGRALYDVTLQNGLPHFSVSAGPVADTWDCSDGPAYCPHGDVKKGVRDQLSQAPGALNSALSECAAVPIDLPCESAQACATSLPAGFFSAFAFNEANARGLPASRAAQFRDALTSPSNWTCAPVAASCAALTGAEETQAPVCQVNLRATDLVPMPDAFSLVWYPGDSSLAPVTAAGALYLALRNQQQADQLERLCTPLPATTLRSFVRRTR